MMYVNNKLAPTGDIGVRDYEDYVQDSHNRFVGTASVSTNQNKWDHWMDQHIGLKYREVDDACAAKDNVVRKVLHERRIPVGERRCYEKLITQVDNYTSHYYTGYKGTLAWEFNLQCSDTSAPNVCTCDPDNNNKLYNAESGVSCADTVSAGDPASIGPSRRDDGAARPAAALHVRSSRLFDNQVLGKPRRTRRKPPGRASCRQARRRRPRINLPVRRRSGPAVVESAGPRLKEQQSPTRRPSSRWSS